MKKTQEIIGLPIISISDGMEVGRVKSIIINSDKGAIDYIVVDSGIQILSARVIPTESVLGVGEYALTIENEHAVNDISKIPATIDLLQKNIQVKGTKVLTKKGRLIGEIGDIYIDENECCKITGLEYIADITQKRIRLIPRDSVITFGKNLTVVTDDVENNLVDRVTQLGTDKPDEGEKKNLVNFNYQSNNIEPRESDLSSEILDVEADKIIAADGQSFYKEVVSKYTEETPNTQQPLFEGFKEDSNDKTESVLFQAMNDEVHNSGATFPNGNYVEKPDSQNVSASQTDTSAASLFEQRQRQYLDGRKAAKTITDNSGNIIIDEGMIITPEIIDNAKLQGKLIELVMNNKA